MVNLQESGEMYLETIYVLSKENKHVRAIDVSEHMGYSKPSVSRAVGILKKGGYLEDNTEDGALVLTEKGRLAAEKTYERHRVLSAFFEKNGEKEFIYNDREALINYFESNKDGIFISGDNYFDDNFMIASIIKNGNPTGDVDYDEIQDLLPVSLDVTQEVVRSNPVKLDKCMLNLNRKAFNYEISNELNTESL